jgi:hypothetical protein
MKVEDGVCIYCVEVEVRMSQKINFIYKLSSGIKSTHPTKFIFWFLILGVYLFFV